MRKFSTSLFIALLALLALPERVWAEDVPVKFLVRVEGSSDAPALYLWNYNSNETLNGAWADTQATDETETINEKTYYKYTVSVPTATALKLITKKSGNVSGNGNQSADSDPFQINSGVSVDYVLVEGSFNNTTKPTVEVVETGSETGHTFYLGCATNNWEKNGGYKFTSESSSGPYTYTLAKGNVSSITTDGYFYVSILPYNNGTQWSSGGNAERICPTNGDGTELTSSASNNNAKANTEFSSWKVKYEDNATGYVFTFNQSNMSFSVVPTLVSETKYTVNISAGEGGSVSLTGDQQIGSTPVNITATPNTGYEFVNWTATGGAKVANASSPTTTVTATQDGTLIANFKTESSTPAPQVEKVKLYVKNAASWTGDMYAYVFKSSTDFNAAYPGVKMTLVTGNDNYNFEYTVPEGYENGYVIFSNGSSEGSKRFPADKRSGFGIRNASHIFNNDNNTWIAPQSSTIEGQNSVTIYAYINNDMAWYPTDGEDGTNGDIKIGTNFYIFAYTNATNSDYHAYVEGSDTKLTINDYNPGYGKTAGTDINDYGDYCDETVYPVGYGSASNLRYAKFVIYYDKELEGQTAFYTLNSGSLGTGQTKYGEGYQIRQLFKADPQNIGETYRGTPYYYELPSVKLENGTSYSFRLGFANYEHKDKDNGFIAFLNYKIEDATSDVAKVIFPTVTLDDDYGCTKGIDNSNGKFFDADAKTNIWDEASTYNVNMYRPFYSDGLYETICLPFDVPATEVSEKFGEGTKLFKVTEATEKSITFTEQTEANCYIEAGVPYIILPQLSEGNKWGACETNGTVITFAAKEMKYAYNEESQQKALSYTDKEGKEQSLTMKGCFIPSLIGKADRFFNTTADNNSVIYQQAYNDRRVIRGTRVFFKDTKDPNVTVSAGGQAQATKRIVLRFDSDQSEATGIYTPETGKVEIFRDARIYSISGQYVGSSLDKLAKGIYVVNGKKIVIR